MKFYGKVTHRLDVKSGVSAKSGKAWKMIEFVAEEIVQQYPMSGKFRVFGEDKVNEVVPLLTKDALVEIDFDLNTEEYKGKYYTTLSAWKVAKWDGKVADNGTPTTTEQKPVENNQPSKASVTDFAPPANAETTEQASPDTSDLPF